MLLDIILRELWCAMYFMLHIYTYVLYSIMFIILRDFYKTEVKKVISKYK